MTTETPPTRSRLRSLLVATDRDPIELAEEIRAEREAHSATGDAAVARDLSARERRFLLAQATRPSAPADLAAAAEDADRAWLGYLRRTLEQSETGSSRALFGLAEVKAALLAKRDEAAAEELGREIDRRVAAIEVDEALVQEARERYVALSTEEEDLDLPHRILLLQEMSAVLGALAERSERKSLARMSRRLWRASCDRVLAQRVEKLLTVRGAALLETSSLLLLVVLFVLIAIESAIPMSESAERLFLTLDASICAFFIAEFLFKLSLSPARSSWFLRNAITDLLPALPAALLFLNVPNVPAGNEAFAVRALRFLRIAYFARYVQALRPVLRIFRLMLFMVRGLDHLVHRFSSLLNRDFVFFSGAENASAPRGEADPRLEVFQALRREHVLLADLPAERRWPLLVERSQRLSEALPEAEAAERRQRVRTSPKRDVPVEEVIEQLHATEPEELGLRMPSGDLAALDRVVRVINAPLVRSLPFLRRLRSRELADSPEERVTDLGRRIADWLESWRDRMLYVADLHGILTGPQILDRVATAMVNASKRPAVRLLLFGGLFLVFRLIVGEDSPIGEFLKRFVATPLLVLGGVCLVVLWLGRWLKKLAGEAAETLKRTSEAHFIGLLELQKSRDEDVDTAFLARRVFRWELKPEEAQWALCRQVEQVRKGLAWVGDAPPEPIREDVNRVALLYLHFLDGAILHESDVKTSEQLLANLSLENIRSDHLGFSRRDRKRLRKLSLGEGSILSGPYIWFRCITESVALETAKRVIDYNRNCLTARHYERASVERRQHMDVWIESRRAEMAGRLIERLDPPGRGSSFVTTEFNALDFLSPDPTREDHIRRIFGDSVADLLRADRRQMIREIFGTKPLDRLPRSRRVINFHALYMRHLSRGRVLLLPILWLVVIARAIGMVVSKTIEIVREILAPESAALERETGVARFAVALRKIHRMKAPGLLEAMATRCAFDPAYCGAPVSWTAGQVQEDRPELERDLDFLQMKERARHELRRQAEIVRRRVDRCHFAFRNAPGFAAGDDELEQRLGERAVTIGYATDRMAMRTLMGAEEWLERTLPEFEDKETRIRTRLFAGTLRWIFRGLRTHPVSLWIDKHASGRRISRRAVRNFKAAYYLDEEVHATVDAWLALPVGESPQRVAFELARELFANHGEISRELAALRAVQSLSVLDVRNYRKLVFGLGGYADEGEDVSVAEALP